MPDLDLGAFLASFPWTTFLVGALLSLFLMLALKPVARRTGWVDKPNFRKAHKGEIPLIGGTVEKKAAGRVDRLLAKDASLVNAVVAGE